MDVLSMFWAHTDAEIMKKEFANGRPLKEYFRPGDA